MAKNDSTKLEIAKSFYSQPLRFEKNLGQTAEEVRFFSRGRGYSFFLTPAESVMVLSKRKDQKDPSGLREGFKGRDLGQFETSVIRMRMAGANPSPHITGKEKLKSASHYFVGNKKDNWHREIPHYEKVHFQEVYPGIDLVYYGNQGELEYDFIVKPGSDPNEIILEFKGADALSLNEQGDLILNTPSGKVIQRAPLAYQVINDEKKTVASRYALESQNRVTFQVANFDRDHELVIDPILKFSTYLGGGSSDEAYSIAVGPDDDVYVTGSTRSMDFDTLNEIEGDDVELDIFVFKLETAPFGMNLVYSTYLGGSSFEQGESIAVDSSGNVFVAGWTDSNDFNTVNPIEGDSGGRDVFVLKISENAGVPSLDFSTYLGGSGLDQAESLALDPQGGIYVAGWTQSGDFDTLNALEGDSGLNDAFVFKLEETPTGPSLIYSTYLGGSFNDEAYAIAVNPSGDAYVAGRTFSPDFDTVNTLDTPDLSSDFFVFKLEENAGVLNLAYSTYLGGSGAEEMSGIAVDATGGAYVTGYTTSTNLELVNPIEGDSGDGTWDAYVFKLQEIAGSPAIAWSTYLGGGAADFAQSIAIDPSGNAFIAGYTLSNDFDLVNEIEGDSAGTDVFIVKLNDSPSGPTRSYSTYLGGDGNDRAFAIAIDSNDDAYIAGWTTSLDYDVVFPIESRSGISDVLVSKIGDTDTTPPVITTPPDITQEATGPVTFLDIGTATVTDDFSAPEFIHLFSNSPGQFVLGTIGITWTAIDQAGNTSTEIQNVTIVDTTIPVLTLNGPNPLAHELGTPFVDPWAIATDIHDGPVPVTAVFNELGPGSFEVVYTATDISGNSTSATRIINFVDTTPPTLTLQGPNPAVFNNVPFVEPGFTAVDTVQGTVPVTVTPSGPQTGTFVLTYTATDFSGNSATATRTVTINDTIPPAISINGANPLNYEIGTAYVDPWANAVDNVDGVLPVTLTTNQISPNQFNVIYTATDAAGNTASATRVVNFLDTTPPTLTLLGPNPAVYNNVPFVEPGFTATDSVQGTVPVTVTPQGPQTGTYVLTYTATDFFGNSATATRTVTVNDTLPPVITLNGANPVILQSGQPYNDPWATALDNVDGVLAVSGEFNQVSPNVIEVTYTATDLAGNTGTATRVVFILP
ncbi:MAG: DUF5011 domain-containing protein [Candidatus Nitronauta litoralis]|uniref:DUF5011 domain-containing protein n=1 Tax=Candidatus Nitronauta litoralis TaxID=2705533 RepID=A0A7T0G0C4_9BACT|nr:MAG: DUF5011 domain-containing protein [Candidatus Nitronauta litoralis]